MLPLSLAHRLITNSVSPSYPNNKSGSTTTTSSLRDVWRVLHPESSLGPANHPDEMRRRVPVPSARFNITENGSTSDGLYNTWRWSKARQKRLRAGDPSLVGDDDRDVRGKRLDYIFASRGSPHGSSSGWVVKSAAVTMTERHPELHVSLSDHFAVRATLTYHTSTSGTSGDDTTTSSPETAKLNEQLTHQPLHDDTFPPETYNEILTIIEKYTIREQREQNWRGISFYVALAVWVGCLVAVWFSPRNFVAFILMLLSSLGLTAGTINGLLALLFFSSELRKLKEFEWEVRTAQALASEDYASLADADSLGAGNISLKSKASSS
jgi:sphingomyelin phosphodiesterase 2